MRRAPLFVCLLFLLVVLISACAQPKSSARSVSSARGLAAAPVATEPQPVEEATAIESQQLGTETPVTEPDPADEGPPATEPTTAPTATLTRVPPPTATRTSPPTATRVSPPTATRTPPPTATRVPPPTATSGPNIADLLKDELYFGVGGGAVECGVVAIPEGAPIPGISSFTDMLCLWEFPLNEPVDIRIASHDGRYDFQATYTTGETEFGFSSLRLLPPPPPEGPVRSWAGAHGMASHFMEVDLKWPIDLPAGLWTAEAVSSAASGVVLIELTRDDFPAVSAVPAEGSNPFKNTCADNGYQDGETINILGANFPPHQEVALGVYLDRPEESGIDLVFATTVPADNQGEITLNLEFEPSDPVGRYYIVATADPQNAFERNPFAGGFVLDRTKGAMDCFTKSKTRA